MFLTSTLNKHLPLRSKFAVLCIVFLLFANLLQGCVTAPTRSEESPQSKETTEQAEHKQSAIRTVAIVASDKQPVADIEGMLGKEAGAALGVVGGAAVGLGIYLLMGFSCAFTAGGCMAIAPLVGWSAIAGGVMGATMEAPADAQRDQAEAATSVLDIQSTLALFVRDGVMHETGYRVVESRYQQGSTNRYVTLAVQGAGTVVEVGLTKIQLDKSGYLRMWGQAHKLSLPGGEIKDTHDFEFVFLESHSATDWVADKGKAIGDALARSLPRIGYRVAEELFVLYPVTFNAVPQPKYNADERPELTWNFQRSYDADSYSSSRTRYPVELAIVEAAVDDVCLDWLARDSGSSIRNIHPPCLLTAPDQIVYSHKGLRGASHWVEANLNPCTTYAWSVRAEFKIEDQTRRSEWASWASLTTRCEPSEGSKS